MIKSLNITIKLEGPTSQDGHVLLNDLVDELRLLQASLNSIDRIVDEKGETALTYRVVNASHSSPLMLELEPTPKKQIKNSHERIERTHARFFQEIGAIQRGAPPSNDVDNATLSNLKRMVDNPGIQAISIKNGHYDVSLDKTFKLNLQRLLRDQDCSQGTLIGKLEALNFHGKSNLFWIYPTIGANKVLCHFPPGQEDKVTKALQHFIEAKGTKFFRVNSPFPYRMEVEDFETVLDSPDENLMELRGIAKGQGAIDSGELIKFARDEWN